jgi:anti-sigma factor RsiW
MNCDGLKRLFPALLSGELPVAMASEAEEHLLACEDCSTEFEAYESRFFAQYEPAGKALSAAAKAPLPEPQLERFYDGLKARLDGACLRVNGTFAAFLAGDLDTAAAEETAAHLQACDACSRAFEAYESRIFAQYERAGKALAAAASVPPPEAALIGFWQKVRVRIHEERRRSASRRAAWAVNAAAALLIAVSIGYLVAGRNSRPASGPEARPETVAGGGKALPPVTPSDGTLTPASSMPVRRYSLENYRPEEFSQNPARRSGGIDVYQPEGHHAVDDVRPLQPGDSVGF